MIETRSANAQLDELLEDVCIALQLSDTRYELATDRYTTVGTRLSCEGTSLPRFSPVSSLRARCGTGRRRSLGAAKSMTLT